MLEEKLLRKYPQVSYLVKEAIEALENAGEDKRLLQEVGEIISEAIGKLSVFNDRFLSEDEISADVLREEFGL